MSDTGSLWKIPDGPISLETKGESADCCPTYDLDDLGQRRGAVLPGRHAGRLGRAGLTRVLSVVLVVCA